MATKVFPWGIVRSTTQGLRLSLSAGTRFHLSPSEIIRASEYIKTLGRFSTIFVGVTGYRVRQNLRLEWSTKPATAKSVLHVGYGDVALSKCGKLVGGWVPGTTQTILNYDEVMELADAIEFIALHHNIAVVAIPTP